jgi:HK97 gp10 family phage protein
MSRNEFKLESNVSEVQYVLSELERAALKEIAKFVRKEAKRRAPVRPGPTGGTLQKNIATWIRRKSGALQLGVYNKQTATKKGLKHAYYAGWVEFGTVRMPAKRFLESAIQDNIDQIRLISGRYIKTIEDENKARGLIDEAEEIADE